MPRNAPDDEPVMARPSRLTIWAISDGRPGHWNQVRGLVEAIERLTTDLVVIPCPAPTRWKSVADLFRGRWKETDLLPDPDLIIGAGHGTHLPMLIARRTRGGRAVVLMEPTFPKRLFDACLIPTTESSKPTHQSSNVIPTRGAVNRMRRSTAMSTDAGTILIGGPSRHVKWNEQRVLDQVFEVCSGTGDVHWHISTSRRTPAGMLEALIQLGLLNVTIVDGYKTGAGWLPNQLAQSAFAWVTTDSISMVYESLTIGSRVGLLEVPVRKPNGKIAQHVKALIQRGDVTAFEQWQKTGTVVTPETAYSEADRCAETLLKRFFTSPAVERAA